MAANNEPRKRFAPVPIETTFQSIRKTQPHTGPSAELTPDASPRSPSPMPREFEFREKRRFAPQLIESSRRTRRAGDAGPTTRPADKTDITPYVKNIYTVKSKPRRRQDSGDDDGPIPHMPPTRRETEDEGVKEYLLELAAKEAERQIQEAALAAAFPNSGREGGGIAHFYFRDSSDSDDSPGDASPTEPHEKPRARRKSSNLGVTWWHKHMQEHAQNLADERGEDEEVVVVQDRDIIMRSDSELDRMELPAPPDALWTTTNKSTPEDTRDSSAGGPLSESRPLPGDVAMLDASRVQVAYATGKIHAPQGQSPFGKPFGSFPSAKPMPAQAQQTRPTVSPPMLGKDLTFRRCPSPKWTKLEPDHPFFQTQADLRLRDTTGQSGLWGGYCYRTDGGSNGAPQTSFAPRMIATPHSPVSPGELDAASQTTDEPASIFSSADSVESATTNELRPKSRQAKGLHMLNGLEERLQKEKAEAERLEKILLEFNDEFITQVYNYLSLGYPATAHDFDDELAKISRTDVEELGRDDEKQIAKGHMLEMTLENNPEETRCPRWRALKTYIIEWAVQHPDLDSLDPMAWGVRERRGSWAF